MPLALLMHHSSGDVTKWRATLTDRGHGLFGGEMLEMRETARVCGAVGPVSAMAAHPLRPLVATMSSDGRGLELTIWRVLPPRDSGFQPTGVMKRSARAYLETAATLAKGGPRSIDGVAIAWVPSTSRTAMIVASGAGLEVFGMGSGEGLPDGSGSSGNLVRLASSTADLTHARLGGVHLGVVSEDKSTYYVVVFREVSTSLTWCHFWGYFIVAPVLNMHLPRALSISLVLRQSAKSRIYVSFHFFELSI